MNYLESIVLALVQGFTEFLPISSSAHLILVPVFMGWDDQGRPTAEKLAELGIVGY